MGVLHNRNCDDRFDLVQLKLDKSLRSLTQRELWYPMCPDMSVPLQFTFMDSLLQEQKKAANPS